MADHAPLSKRQRKFAEAKERNMTRGQLWRAREKKQRKGKNINTLRGKRAILVVTNRGRERLGTNEAIQILGLDEQSDDEDEDDAKGDIQAALAKELEQARSKNTARYDLSMPCLSAIESHGDPVEIVSRLFSSVIAEGKARSTHVEKLIPLDRICYPSVESITTCATELLKDTFSPESPSQSFAVMAKIRGNSSEAGSLSRTDVNNAIAALIDQKKHPVNLTEPDVVIVVEVVRSIAGISVVKGSDYRLFKKFNLRNLVEPGGGDDE